MAFRDHPGNMTAAGAVVGLDKRTARKAWNEGWPSRGADWGPIKHIIQAEQRAARAAAVEAESATKVRRAEAEMERAHAEAEKARKDVVASRRAEAEIVRGERANVMALIAATGITLRGAMDQAATIEMAIRAGSDPATNKPLTLLEKIKILSELGKLVRTASEAAVDVVKVERLLLGEPTEIVGTKNLDTITEEDAIAELERAGKVGTRMKERRERRLRLIQGDGS